MKKLGIFVFEIMLICLPVFVQMSNAGGSAYDKLEKKRIAGIDDSYKKCSEAGKKSFENGVKCLEKKYPNLIGGLNCDSLEENKAYLIGYMCRLALKIKSNKSISKLDRQDLIISMEEYRDLSSEDYALVQCSDDQFINSIYNQSIKNFYCDSKLRNDDLNVTKSDRERLQAKRDQVQYICGKAKSSSKAGLQQDLNKYKTLMGTEFDFNICQALNGRIKGIDH